jgi:hypothetical protein
MKVIYEPTYKDIEDFALFACRGGDLKIGTIARWYLASDLVRGGVLNSA